MLIQTKRVLFQVWLNERGDNVNNDDDTEETDAALLRRLHRFLPPKIPLGKSHPNLDYLESH